MAVRTTANECLDEARDSVQKAAQAMSHIVIDKVWGYDSFAPNHRLRHSRALTLLLEVQSLLGDF